MTKERSVDAAVIRRCLKDAFDKQALTASDEKGYVPFPSDNLVNGVFLLQFKGDLDGGAGNELRCKFCAVHSSCALAVNTFARFKDNPAELALLGRTGFAAPVFEKQLTSGLGGTSPTLDVFLRCGDEVIAIESKFLEYFERKPAVFSKSYNELEEGADSRWLAAMKDAKAAGRRHLDVAQLVKHYFGLNRLLAQGDETGWRPTGATLLYLYWEPEDADSVEVCRRHRAEIGDLERRVRGSMVRFKSMSHPALWREWAANPVLADHAARLRQRYSVRVTGYD